MAFDLTGLLASRSGEGYRLHAEYLNPQLPRMLHAIDFDTVYERGEGSWLTDEDGTRYLDFLSGFGVFGLGRSHPVVRKALHDALDAGTADLVQMDTPLLAGLLAEQLLARAPGLDRVFFCNSGTEAVEAALKFARATTGRPRVLYCDHAFHGLTAGSLSTNGGEEFRRGFDPLLPDTSVRYGDLDDLRRELAAGDVAALIVEPIQGKGVYVAPPGYLAEAAELLHRNGALLICDEVQTGVGRTGTFFAHEADGVRPDIVTMAKSLSGGYVPIGATLATNRVFERVYSSMDRALRHSSTFAGNTLAMTAGLATLAVLDEEDLIPNARRTGNQLLERLTALQERYELLADVRGRGLMIGIEFGAPRSLKLRGNWAMLQTARRGLFSQMVVGLLHQRHRILTQVAADHLEVIKLLPTFVLGDEEIDLFVEAFTDVLDEAHRGSGLAWGFGRTLVRQAMKR